MRSGDLLSPRRTLWLKDPSGLKAAVLTRDVSWPAVLIDGEDETGLTSAGWSYTYRRILLASGEVVEVTPDFLRECDGLT